MSSDVSEKNAGFQFIWIIENFSYCLPWMKLKSPTFIVNSLEKTAWHLLIRVRGDLDPMYISFVLCRDGDDSVPSTLDVEFELSFLAEDMSPLVKKQSKGSFAAKSVCGFCKFLEFGDLLTKKKVDFLPKEELNVSCRMWSPYKEVLNGDLQLARSRMGLEHASYFWAVEGFSNLHPGQKKSLLVQTTSMHVPSLSMVLFLKDGFDDCDEIQIEITQGDGYESNMSSCEISLIDIHGKVALSKLDKHWFDSTKRHIIWVFPTFLYKNKLLVDKSLCLPNDVLTLKCEWKMDIGVVSSRVEGCRQSSTSDVQRIRVAMDPIGYDGDGICESSGISKYLLIAKAFPNPS